MSSAETWTSWADFFSNLYAQFTGIQNELWQSTLETLYMTGASTALSLLGGALLAVVLIIIHPRHGLSPVKWLYMLLSFVVNLGRSFPFIILLICVIPMTRAIVGTTIGSTAAVVPLTVAAIPFVARLLEANFLEVDRGVIEAARSFGANNLQIVYKILFPEALPAIVLNVAVLGITLLGYSAMAGIVGGGGLGDLAIKYGYNRFELEVMFFAVVVLCLIVLAIQGVGNLLYRVLR